MSAPGDRPPAPARAVAGLPPGKRRRRLAAGLVVAAGVASWCGWVGLRRPDPDALWAEAERALRTGRFSEARAALGRIERLRPKTGEDLILQAQLATAAGATDEALDALARVPDGHPLAAQARLLAGRLERQRNRLRPAEAAFRGALALDPGLIEAHRELIFIYGFQARRREADAEFRALARLTPLTHHDLFTWALTHFTSWRPDVAKDLQSFVDADPGDRHSRLALAEALLDQPGQAERAERLLDALPASDPDAMALRVALVLHQDRLPDAERLLRDGPKDHPALARFRGRLAMLRNDPADAVEHFRIALSSEPYDRVSTRDLGQALRLTGREREAEEFLARSRRLDELYNRVIRVGSPDRENQPPDLMRLGVACEDAGLIDEARGWYGLAIATDPLDGSAQQGLHRVGRKGPTVRTR